MRKLLFLLKILTIFAAPEATFAESSILESFDVTTQNAVVRESTESSLHLKSSHRAYFVKLEPNEYGNVVFSLSDINYATTAAMAGNLAFGVRITGFRGEDIVNPIINVDDVNDKIFIQGNVVKFQNINGSIPVMFDRQVDSVNLEFFNNYEMDVKQYVAIHDLRIMQIEETCPNPILAQADGGSIMIGIDGSSSINKKERTVIGKQMLNLVKRSGYAKDTNAMAIVEFGSDIHANTQSTDHKELYKAIKNYRKGKNRPGKKKATSWTNWAAAFDAAIEAQPEIFVFITDGWSNWEAEGPSSFVGQYQELVEKTNQLKKNGTRLLFITCGLTNFGGGQSTIYAFLNGTTTRELYDIELGPDVQLHEIDLISLTEFQSLDAINLATVFDVPEEVVEEDVSEPLERTRE